MSNVNNTKPFFMPTPYFAIPLGLGAMAIAWSHTAHLLAFGELISQILGVTAVITWGLFITLYIYKIFAYHDQVKEEWLCPVRFSFIALIPITTMIVGILLHHWKVPYLGEGLIWLGVISQLIYACIRIGSLWKGDVFTEDSVQPPFYLPSVASNFTSASGLAILGYQDLAYLFLGAGMIAWVMFEPVLLQRLRVNQIAPTAKATMGIILAPAFVGVASYLTVNGGQVDIFVKFLWGYGFLQLLLLLRVFPWIASNGFVLGLWSFSFGLASMANSAVTFYQNSQLGYLAIATFVFSNIMIGLLVLGTLTKILQGKFWLK